ncbi:MAG: winged helix-turn-helix domain-containing protein [Prevotellaceae bacterium]|nr:winged helix-turn-helix domain-containing protein [Prevotellaceae bacterium]
MSANLWDGKSLSAYISAKYGITLKTRSCQKLLHELGFSLKRARPTVALGDEAQKTEAKKTQDERRKW